MLNDINTRALLGEPVDLLAYSQAVSTLVRVAAKLGVRRVPRDVTIDPLDYAREHSP
jgi:hypothetical protein